MPQSIVDSIRYLDLRLSHADIPLCRSTGDDYGMWKIIFRLKKKAASDGGNADVEKWEKLMEKFQREIKDPEGKQTGNGSGGTVFRFESTPGIDMMQGC